MSIFWVIRICFLSLLLASCGSDDSVVPVIEKGRGKYNVSDLRDILIDEIDQSNLGVKQKALATDALSKSDNSLSGDNIYQSLVEIDVKLSRNANTAEEIEQRQTIILDAMPSTPDAYNFKSVYEKIIQEDILNKNLIYNKAFNSIRSLLFVGKYQCLSGTLNYLTLRLKALGLQAFYEDYPVVILTKGHILPGKIARDLNGDFWLYGIETTAAGKALIKFGKTKSLDSNKVRVLDAIDYMVTRTFQHDLFDKNKVKDELLNKAAKEFDITLKNTSALKDNKNAFGKTKEKGAQDIFAFGQSNQANGDFKREIIHSQVSQYAAPLDTEERFTYPLPGELQVANVNDGHIDYKEETLPTCKRKSYKNINCQVFHVTDYKIKNLEIFPKKLIIEDTNGVLELPLGQDIHHIEGKLEFFSCDITGHLLRSIYVPSEGRHFRSNFQLFNDAFQVYGEWPIKNSTDPNRKTFMIDMECRIN